MITIDMVEKIVPPAERYQRRRKELIEQYQNEIKIISLQSKKFKPDLYKPQIESAKKAYAITHFSFPYIEKYIEWEHTALAQPVISIEDFVLIGNTIIFALDIEAVDTFIFSVSEQGYLWDELAQKYIDNPEGAEKPLTKKEEQQFIFFLDNVFKPAFLDLVENIRQGHYRPIEEINNDINAILQKKVFSSDNDFVNLFNERYDPANDLRKFMQKYSETCGFCDILTTGQGDISLEIERLEPPEKAQVLYPESLAINITKPAHFLSEIEEFDDPHYYRVSKSKAKLQRLVSVTLFPENNDSVKLSRPISIYDRAIIDAVETLAERNKYITASAVYRMMNGGGNIKVTAETTEEIESRIDYMCQIRAKVDYSEHIQMNLKKELTDKEKVQYTRKGYLLNLDEESVILNGKKVVAYKHNAVNPLTKYAKDVGQIATVPAAMLNTKDGQRGGKRAQSIKHYLLQRIYTIPGQGDTISLDSLLEAIGEESASADQLKRIRKTIENFLDLWSYGKIKTSKDKPNKEILAATPIKGYNVKTVGKKITGYILIPKVVEAAKKK